MMAINSRLKPWAAAVGAMLDKALPFLISVGEAPLFDRIYIDRGDIAFIAGLPSSMVTDARVGDRLTKGEALELLQRQGDFRWAERAQIDWDEPGIPLLIRWCNLRKKA